MLALTCVGVTSPMSSESLLDVLWHGLVCSSWTISVTADTQIRLGSGRKNADPHLH